MNQTQDIFTPKTPAPPGPEQLLRIARAAAELAVAAADHATETVCNSRSGSTPGLEEAMYTAHAHAREAEKYAGWAAGWQADDTTEHVLRRYATSAAAAAVRAQSAAGVEVTAAALRSQLDQEPTASEHAERESRRRRQESQWEAEERAVTGMDENNRDLARRNAYYAEDAVPELGWTVGHMRVLEAAETGRLYWRDDQARQAAQHGQWESGRRVSSERTRALYGARFLIGARQDDGTRPLTLSPMGQVALELARLHPEGLYATDKDAYQARYDRVAKRHQRSDDKKAAAHRLPPLDSSAFRLYRRPVTLAEQELQAQREAAEQWEDEGGYCPGAQTSHPAADTQSQPAPTGPRASAPATPATPAGQELLRRLFAPRARTAPLPDPTRTVIRRPQRILTPEERQVVRNLPALALHRSLHLGIVDPVPNPSPMSEDEGEWVREHAWPRHFDATERHYPWGFKRWSTCEKGTCWNCRAGRCDICLHRQNGPVVDGNVDIVYGHSGRHAADLILRPDGAPCVWWCRCACPKDGPIPNRTAPTEKALEQTDEPSAVKPARRDREDPEAGQGALF